MGWMMIDKRRNAVTNLDKNVVPIELAGMRVFGHIFQMHNLNVSSRWGGKRKDVDRGVTELMRGSLDRFILMF